MIVGDLAEVVGQVMQILKILQVLPLQERVIGVEDLSGLDVNHGVKVEQHVVVQSAVWKLPEVAQLVQS